MNLDVGSGAGPYKWVPRADVCASLDVPRVHGGPESIVRCDALYLPFRERAFDTVFAFNLLEHVPYPFRVLLELRRVGRSRVHLRQDSIFNLVNYATPEHLWFQLPNLKFLPYPRTRLGIFFSISLKRVLLECQLFSRRWSFLRLQWWASWFMTPHQQYDVVIDLDDRHRIK